MSSSLPPKIAFFCPICVNEKGIIKRSYGNYNESIVCNECDNKRLIVPHKRIHKLTQNYCMPEESLWDDEIKPGSYFILLMTNAEAQGGISAEFIETNGLVNTARFIKDRFFFGIKLDREIYPLAEDFITEIAWIPRNE
jgi:hypothetical protein